MGPKRLYKTSYNKKICGVCNGLAEYFSIDPTVVRLGWVVLTCLAFFAGVVIYIIAALIMPDKNELDRGDGNNV